MSKFIVIPFMCEKKGLLKNLKNIASQKKLFNDAYFMIT